MSDATLYKIEQTAVRDHLNVIEVSTNDLAESYTSTCIIEVSNKQYLIGYNKESGHTDSYLLTDAAPWLQQVENGLNFTQGWDIVEPFYIANKPYVCCYQSSNGHLYFYPITDGLANAEPLHFYHTRYPYTTGLTEVKALVSQGQVFIVGYNGENGDINFWTVSATSRSLGDEPPLVVKNVWAHQWAKGWTRFAFFTWGNENFFLKTNTWKPNVNIDHVSDVLSQGTNEVGSHLQLKDDQSLNIVRPFMDELGDPYFLTYLAGSGESTFNRIHGNCLGWTICTTVNLVPDATHILTYCLGQTTYALYI